MGVVSLIGSAAEKPTTGKIADPPDEARSAENAEAGKKTETAGRTPASRDGDARVLPNPGSRVS